jgi:hypothetical protein
MILEMCREDGGLLARQRTRYVLGHRTERMGWLDQQSSRIHYGQMTYRFHASKETIIQKRRAAPGSAAHLGFGVQVAG